AAAGLEWDDLLEHFNDKEQLLAAIVEEGWQDLLLGLPDVTSTTPHTALVNLFAYLTNALHKDEDLVRLLLFEGRRPQREAGGLALSEGYRQFMQLCRDLVARGQRDGSFQPAYHPQVAASMLVGALEGMLRDRLIAEQEHGVTGYTSTYLLSTYGALVSSLQN
ncbi:MAG TPA: TetR/AcrR family transcriptional regulator, partial [Gammaproteobacteria bacterium]